MSELLERVEYAIDYQIQNHGFGPHVARAAILAVLEHYSEAGNVSSPMVQAILNAQFDELSHDLTADARRRFYFAAAMRAEKERMKGEKHD